MNVLPPIKQAVQNSHLITTSSTLRPLIQVTPVLDKGIASQDDLGSIKSSKGSISEEMVDDSIPQYPRLQLTSEEKDFLKKKVSNCLLIILSQKMKSENLKRLEENSVIIYQHRIHARERRNT
ncbi:uncharacterized protein LOC111871514 [Cryptotermes secundus]|uniref:uncharacterized protein LOC111871514 n=1 Tax=Cryptotermes secundus TaxID=105785 RepID=UPI000CD7BD78|nr:uncharacterized protein LOC111871514 [Cryptotermes secundus]